MPSNSAETIEPVATPATDSDAARLVAEAAAAEGGAATKASRLAPRKVTCVVVGSGPAGLGTAGLLKQCGIDVVVLERGEIGQTFKSW